jgi:hypothetical protein
MVKGPNCIVAGKAKPVFHEDNSHLYDTKIVDDVGGESWKPWLNEVLG